jgi:hypothetical protein
LFFFPKGAVLRIRLLVDLKIARIMLQKCFEKLKAERNFSWALANFQISLYSFASLLAR